MGKCSLLHKAAVVHCRKSCAAELHLFCCSENPPCSLGSFLLWQRVWSRASPASKAALAFDGNSAPIVHSTSFISPPAQTHSLPDKFNWLLGVELWKRVSVGNHHKGKELVCVKVPSTSASRAGGRPGSIVIQHTGAAWLNRAFGPFILVFDRP